MLLVINLIIYCLILSIYLYFTLAVNPRIWMHRMPQAVIDKVEQRTKREKKLLVLLGIPFIIFTALYPFIYVFINYDELFDIIIIFFIFFLTFDIWDTLILDLLIFCTITPRFMIINGTQKEDYSNKRYHIISGVKGILISVVMSILFGFILYFIK